MAKTLKTLVAGPGLLQWVVISGEGKADLQGRMQYTAEVALEQDSPEYAKVKAAIDAFWEENKPKGFKRKPKSNGLYLIDPILDENGEQAYDDEGKKMFDPKGKVGVRMKTTTVWPDGNPKVVQVFNAKNMKVNLGDKKIGNGSVGLLQGKMGIYENKNPSTGAVLEAGVTLYLDKVQVRKLVEYSADDVAFDTSEDENAFMGFEDDNFGEGFEDNTQASTPAARL